jgi:hypothetical protein
MSKYKFYITHNAITTEVFPLFDSLKFSHKKEGFRYSKECKTAFTFTNNNKDSISDFTTILAIDNGLNRCEDITFEIKKTCDKGATYTSHWIGSFSTTDCKFDLDKCTCVFTPDVVDKYSCLNKSKGRKINVLNTPRFSIDSEYKDLPTTIEFTTCFGEDCFSNPAWAHIDTYTLHVDDVPWDYIISTYAMEVAYVPDVGTVTQRPSSDPNWILIDGSSNPSKWGRPYIGSPMIRYIVQGPTVDGIENIGTGHYEPPADSYYCPDGSSAPATATGYHPYQLVKNNFTYIALGDPDQPLTPRKYKCLDFYFAVPFEVRTISQFHTVYNCLLYIVNQICPGITGMVSDFFEWNPLGDATGYVPGNNYVTGASNIVSRLAMAQKLDVAKVHPDQYASIAEISFDALISDLCTTFNLDWFIDSSNRLRIEHISYFTSVLGYNSTVAPHAEYNISNNKYSYAKEKMPNRETFSFMEAQGNDFIGKDIVYSGSCVEQDNNKDGAGSKSYSVSNFTTDLNYIDNYPGNISNQGFVMVAYDSSNKVVQELGKISGYVVNNGHLSWANLQYNYYRHGRVLLTGNMNGINQSFFTAISNKVQDNVKLQLCCDDDIFDPTGKLVQTELGIGEVDSAEEENNIVKIKLNL